jgi:outer membrane receptor protein involved in Fe transport
LSADAVSRRRVSVRRLLLTMLAATPGRAVPARGQSPGDTVRVDSSRVSRLPKLTVAAARPRAAAPPVTTLEIAPEALRRTQAINSYDLIRRTAGIEVHDQGQGPGYASDVVLRGFSSDHSSDVLLTIDGVPINLPVHGHVEGYADWSVLSPAAVSSLHVISGTASPLYGDFALGGVIEVFTAPDADGAAGAFAGSSHGDLSGWLRAGRRRATGGFLIAGEPHRQQGWRDNSAYWLGNGLLRGWRNLGSARVEGGFAGYGSKWDSPGFVSVADYNAGRLTGAMDSSDGGSAQRLIAHGRLNATLGRVGLDASSWAQRVRSSVYLTIPEDGALNQSDEEDRRWAFGGRVQLTRALGSGDLSAGSDGRMDFAQYDLYRTEVRSRARPTKGFRGRYAGIGGYLRFRRLLGAHLALDLGARGDVLHYRSRDNLATAPQWSSSTRVILGPKLGARWLASSSVTLLASVSRGFRGAPGVIEDPTIPAIEAWTKEVGIQYDRGALALHLAAFRLDVRHERIQDPVTRQISATGGSVRQGLNAEAEVRLGAGVILFGEGTLNDAKISGAVSDGQQRIVARVVRDSVAPAPSFHVEPFAPGDPIPNVSRYVGRAGLEARIARRATGRAVVRFSGPYTPIGEPAARTRSYAVIDLAASLPIAPLHAALDLDLDNLLSSKYPEIRASGYLNPGAPRVLLLALRFAGRP